jgi:hypothetical protein
VTSETVGEALRRWRVQRQLTLRQLGKMVNYSHVYVWEIEKGTKRPPPEFIAACDDRLHAGGQLIAAAARARPVDGGPAIGELGLTFAQHWSEGLDTVTSLWRHDAGRRRFMHDAAHVSAALTLPVQQWLNLTDQPGQPATPSAEAPAAETVRAMTRTFRALDNRYGGGQIRPAVVRYLDAEVTPLLRNAAPAELGAPTLSAIAEMTQLAGWLAYDTCEHGLAQRYLTQALGLASAAHDRALGAEILAAMSHQAIFLGENRPAVDLAEAAQRTATRANIPALVAEASVMKAHAYAQLGDEPNSTAALTAAEKVFENADRANDPHWMGYFDEAYLAAISGHCFRALGHQRLAERSARRSLDMNTGYVRGRLFNQLLLAGSHVLARDVGQACTVGHQALDLAEQMSSARAITYIDRLVRDLKPWRTDARVKEFTERARLVTSQTA